MTIKSQDTARTQFSLDPISGLLTHVRQLPSPNFDDRPAGDIVEALVIHAISLPPGKYGGAFVEQFFCNRLDKEAHPYFAEISEMKVSAHFYIHRNGEIVQFVPVNKRAWHAGTSSCMGREAVNDFSIGIELEGCDDDTFEDAQYQALVELSNALLSSISTLSVKNIYGHSDIAQGRKTDPGPGFDWKVYRKALSTEDDQKTAKDADTRDSTA